MEVLILRRQEIVERHAALRVRLGAEDVRRLIQCECNVSGGGDFLAVHDDVVSLANDSGEAVHALAIYDDFAGGDEVLTGAP